MAAAEVAATQESEQTRDGAAAAHRGGPAAAPAESVALARVQAIRGQGWDAVEQVADVIKKNPGEQAELMKWLHQNRGNDFVQHVVGEMSGKPSKATKYPIVLLHGLGGSPGSFDAAIPAGLREDGDAVFEVTAPPFESPEARAKALEPQLAAILAKTGAAKLNLIGWSEGGLDARYLISSLGWADRVASLSMLGTPNRGSADADKIDDAAHLTDAVLGDIHEALGHISAAATRDKKQAAHATLPPELGPVLTRIDTELGRIMGAHTISLAALAGKVQSHESKLKGELAARAAELAHRLQAAIPGDVEPTLDGIVRNLGVQAGNSMAGDANATATMASLSEKDAVAFNKANPDAKGVYYQSWAGVATMDGKLSDAQIAELKKLGPMAESNGDPHTAAKLPPKLWATALGAKSRENGDLNDGAVGVKSAEWGHFQGEIPADHLDLVNSKASGDQARTGFDAEEFYRQLAAGLAKRGD